MNEQEIPDGCAGLVHLLLAALTGGDAQAWARCVAAIEPGLRSLFHGKCHFRPTEADTVDDLIQDVLTTLVVRREQVAAGLRDRGIGYVWTLAYNQYVSWLRQKKRRPEASQRPETPPDPPGPDVAEAIARREYGVWLASNLERILKPEELEIVQLRTVGVLRFDDRMTFDAIGELLGRTCAAVGSSYDRALKKIRRWAEENAIEPEAIVDAIVQLLSRCPPKNRETNHA